MKKNFRIRKLIIKILEISSLKNFIKNFSSVERIFPGFVKLIDKIRKVQFINLITLTSIGLKQKKNK